MSVRLFHYPPSLCSQKVRLALQEKRVEWVSRIVDIGPAMENYEGWYARINPRMVVPTLEHEGRIVTDSARIIRYVDEHLDGPSLSPETAEQRDEMETWIDLQDDFPFRELSYSRAPALANLMVSRSFDLRRRSLRRGLEENPDLSEQYEARLEDIDNWEATLQDAGEVAQLESEISEIIERFEGHIDGCTWLIGDSYTLGDVAWTVILARMRQLGLDDQWGPATAAYYDRLRARPSFEDADIWESKRPLELLPRMIKSVSRRIFG